MNRNGIEWKRVELGYGLERWESNKAFVQSFYGHTRNVKEKAVAWRAYKNGVQIGRYFRSRDAAMEAVDKA